MVSMGLGAACADVLSASAPGCAASGWHKSSSSAPPRPGGTAGLRVTCPAQGLRKDCSVCVDDEECPRAPCARRPGRLRSSPRTPASVRSHGSVFSSPKSYYSDAGSCWGEADQTVIMFDWDDTLFPTHYVWSDKRLKWHKLAPCWDPDGDPNMSAYTTQNQPEGTPDMTMREALAEHASTTAALLRLAVTLAHVVIITLAGEGWVETSIRNFLPQLEGLLEELRIEVHYCRKSVPARYKMMMNEEANDLTKMLKTRTMTHVLKHIYGRSRSGRPRDWKNVLSIGDSAAERLALQDVLWWRRQKDSRGADRECRCKVLKLIGSPSLEKLTVELQVVTSWLQVLVQHNGDMDLDFEELDEDSPVSSNRPARSRVEWRDDEVPRDACADAAKAGSSRFCPSTSSPSQEATHDATEKAMESTHSWNSMKHTLSVSSLTSLDDDAPQRRPSKFGPREARRMQAKNWRPLPLDHAEETNLDVLDEDLSSQAFSAPSRVQSVGSRRSSVSSAEEAHEPAPVQGSPGRPGRPADTAVVTNWEALQPVVRRAARLNTMPASAGLPAECLWARQLSSPSSRRRGSSSLPPHGQHEPRIRMRGSCP